MRSIGIRRVVTNMNHEREEIKASRDFKKLQELLQELVGQPCLRANYTYGDELELHFGDPQPYRHPKLAGRNRGSWVLRTFVTPWAILPEGFDGPGLHGPSFDPVQEIAREALGKQVTPPHEAELASLAGRQVEKIVVFEGRRVLVIEFKAGPIWIALSEFAQPEVDLPVWELTTPWRTYFQVFDRPFPTWSYLRSDVPAHP